MTDAEDVNRRETLLQRNTQAWEDELGEVSNKYDSSMKKNTGFIRKVRTISADQLQNVMKDIETLSLEKYLSEIVTSLTEGLMKVSKSDDIVAATEIVSRLHQRFSVNFTSELLTNFVAGLASPLKADDAEKIELRVSRQKNLIRLLTEFYLVGVFRTIRDCPRDSLPEYVIKRYIKSSHDPIVVTLLKDILNHDFKSGNSIPVAQAFLKRFHPLVFGDVSGFDEDSKKTLKQIFEIYSKAIWENLKELSKQRNYIMNQNRKSAIRTGRLFEENQEQYDAVNGIFEKFKAGAEFLSPIINVPVPNLDEKYEVDDSGAFVAVVKTKSGNEDDLKIWENVKEKNFYTIIPTVEELLDEYADSDKIHLNTSVTDGEKVNNFIARFELMSDKVDVDLSVVEFNKLLLNNKATKNRLLKFFMEVNQSDNSKFYARFLRINQTALKELIDDLVEYLDKGFRMQLNSNFINFKNILFFTELVKFKLIPSHIVFHKIRTLTMKLTESNNIDILSIVYEKCGRFLLHDPDSQDLMKDMLDLLKEKSKDEHLKIDEKLGIKNILFIISPPDTNVNDLKINSRPELSLIEEFLVQLLKVDLIKRTYESISTTLVKIDFQNDILAQKMFIDILSKPETVIYENLEYLAKILSDVATKGANSFLAVKVLDSLIEGIIRNLEVNNFKANRSRTNQLKLMAELYNVELVNFKFIIDLCYKIICFGYANNQPLPMDYDNQMDHPKNYFRIQLCSILLCSLKTIIIAGKRKRNSKLARLNQNNRDTFKTFFVFFQYYSFCKAQPIPIDIRFKIDDIYEKYKKYYEDGDLERLEDLGSAVQRLQIIIQKQGLKVEEEEEEDEEDEEEDEEDIVEVGETVDEVSDDDDDDDDDEDDDDDFDVSGSDVDSEEEDSDLVDSSEEEEVDDEIEELSARDEFTKSIDREYQKLISESIDRTFTYNRNGRISSQKSLPFPGQISSQKLGTTSDPKKLSFSLMTKKDKNADYKQLNISVDDKFATGLLKERTTKQHNKEKLVNLILNMQDD